MGIGLSNFEFSQLYLPVSDDVFGRPCGHAWAVITLVRRWFNLVVLTMMTLQMRCWCIMCRVVSVLRMFRAASERHRPRVSRLAEQQFHARPKACASADLFVASYSRLTDVLDISFDFLHNYSSLPYTKSNLKTPTLDMSFNRFYWCQWNF